MSGALNSVLGGGGLGALTSIASMVFPPAGLAMAAANIASQAIGAAVNEAGKQMQQELGMPKFLQDLIGKVVDEVLGKNQKDCDPGCESAANGNRDVQDWKQDFIKDMAKCMFDAVKDSVDGDRDKCGEGKGGGKGGKAGGSWLVALASALGEVAGQKAGKMVELSDKLVKLGEEGQGAKEGSKEQKANAQESVKTQNELNGVSKEFQQFMETINTVVKGIGDGQTSVCCRDPEGTVALAVPSVRRFDRVACRRLWAPFVCLAAGH